MRKSAEINEAFSARKKLESYRSFFLVGIGGAGMSALARMLDHRGYAVEGTDSTASPETERLDAEGIRVRIGHSGEGIRSDHALVLTDAIDLKASPEVARARELGVPLFRRSQVLGWLLRDKKVIAVTGTHGKTTTTGMVGAGLRAAGLDPLVVVGASIPEWGGPVVEGNGEWAVVEACEAYDAFHDIDPQVVVLTNLELDHVDFHGNWDNLRNSVSRFVSKIPANGALVYCADDSGATEIADRFSGEKRGFHEDSFGKPIHPGSDKTWGQYLRLPGRHNWINANLAISAISLTGADTTVALEEGIARFSGAERRLQLIHDDAVTVIDDYAHHPTEIEASLRAISDRYPYRRVVVVYQPHLYSRTEPLINEFAQALDFADEVVLTDIYPAREDPIPGVSSARIAERVTKPITYIPNRHLLPRKVAQMIRPGDVVVGMGAGNIAEFASALVQEIRRKDRTVKRVAVIYGGDSAEREVSLLSGKSVHQALVRRGFEAYLLDVSELLIRSGSVAALSGPERADVAFLAVHGTHAEDGAIQGLLELLHIPYTGSGILASAVAMDKEATKRLLMSVGIQVPRGVLITREGDRTVSFSGPYVVKPNAQGSTVGLTFVDRLEDLSPAIDKALRYDDSCLVEECVVGMEISVPVLGNRALPPVEIAPTKGRYDFESKYTPGATEEIVPARLPETVLEEARQTALKAHTALGCAGATRTDMIVRTAHGGHELFALEVNTLPGMTATSLLPNSAQTVGMTYDELCSWLVEDALSRYAKA